MPGPIFSQDALQQAILRTPATSPQTPQSSFQPPQQQGPSMAGPYAAIIGGNALDGFSTAHALTNTPGAQEANPFMSGNPGVNALQKAGTTAAELFLVHKLAQAGHPTAGRLLGYLLGGVSGAAGIHNLTLPK